MTDFNATQSKGHYIDGRWVEGAGPPLISINPATNKSLWHGHHATEQEITHAAFSARRALISWSELDFEQRAHYALEFARQIEKKRTQLATLISLETGKPLWESHTEVSAVIGKINLSIQAYKDRTWPKDTQSAEANMCLRYKPQGVVVVLGAFNFPAHLSNGHIVPALLAGNTVLYKPSQHTPSVAELVMTCWHEAGLPKGVLQCLQGGASSGSFLLSLDIQGVYFTGSYATGLFIHQHFSLKPEVILALEMGGNNPLIIDELTHIDAALYQTLLSTMITSGQRCTCARRLLIPNNEFGDEFLSRFIKACLSLTIGAFDAPIEPFMGPVIHPNEALKHLECQKNLIQLGGTPLLPMTLMREDLGFLSPGIIDMTDVAHPPDEEVFAPFVQIHRYDGFDEAIGLANQTRYGLCAGLLGDSEENYRLFYQKIRAGLINWNRPTTGASSSLPFGGVGLSGNHRPSAYFAADYCAYPIACMEQAQLSLPKEQVPGITLE